MDFFAHQEKARRRTWWLVVLFFAALAGIIATTYFACMMIVQYGLRPSDPAAASQFSSNIMWDPSVMLGVSSLVSLVVFGGTAFKLSQLKQGGSKVAEMMGGRLLNRTSTQFHERRLLNVVEEMALASGIPIPPVYVMADQKSINAFAAGYSIHDAVIGVTEGAMKGLKREELQGVIAHEFSHILNGDMRMNIRLIGIVHGLLVLAIIGRIMLRVSGNSRGSSKKGGGVALMIALGLALMIIGYAGYFFGGLIKRAVSRQREYLADASAVQFTRNPLGLAGALKKIGGLARGGTIENNRAEEISHMFFADGIKRFMGAGSLFSTHPPLEQRVKILDPSFDGEFPVITEDSLFLSGSDTPEPAKPDKGRAFIQRTVAMGGGSFTDPQQIMQQVGVLDAAGMDAASDIKAGIPKELQTIAREPIGAQAVLLALIITVTDQESSPDAWTWIPAGLTDSVNRSFDHISNVAPEHRLALVDLSVPALRLMSTEQAQRFLEVLTSIINADNRVDLFEFAVYEIVRASMRDKLATKSPRITITSVAHVMNECAILLSMLAFAGNSDANKASSAFDAGAALFENKPADFVLRPAEKMTIDDLSASLASMLKTSMPVRQKILEAALVCLMADQQATIKELEIFRAFAAALEVPVPPGLLR